MWHTYWECVANDRIQDPHIAKSAGLVRQAQKNWDKVPGLYARGIMPQSAMNKTNKVSFVEAKTWTDKNFAKALKENGKAYSGGSGGPEKCPKQMSKVSFGATTLMMEVHKGDKATIKNVAIMGGQVPGKQTVPRAELWGAIKVLELAETQDPIDLGIDAAYVTNGVTKMAQLVEGENGDLWSILYRLINQRTGPTSIF